MMGLLLLTVGAAATALALLSTASGGVTSPQSGWYSGNPLLGPNALRDIACSGSTCYAAGDFGTVLRSRDGGATWQGIVTGLTVDLKRVGVAGGSASKVLIASDCALRRSDDSGDRFVLLPFSAVDTGCAESLVAFSFPTEQAGYVLLSGGVLLLTTDGGQSWSRGTNVPQVSSDLMCTTATTCFAAGSGGIVRTSDSGVSWTVVATSDVPMLRLARGDSNTLYAGGKFGYLAKSIDGGETWTSHYLVGSQTGDLTDIECGDSLHCLMATHNGTLDGPVVWTHDGGSTASAVTPSTDPTYAVGAASPLAALAAGALGNAEVSNDAGATWTAVGTRVAASLSVLEAAADTTSVAYAGGARGALVRTGDAGQTWSRVSPPIGADLRALAAAGPSRLYVYASDGSLRRSDNGGQSYRLLNTGTFRPLGIAAIDPDRLLLLGRGLALSANAGGSFQRARGQVARERFFGADKVGYNAFLVYGTRAVYQTGDRGEHWQRVRRPNRHEIIDVDFVDPNHGYIVASGKLWRTGDRGRHWRLVPSIGSRVYAIEFSSRTDGYAVPSLGSRWRNGVVLRTTDAGLSWRPQLVSPQGVAAVESSVHIDYALAGASLLYATTVGGDVGEPTGITIRSSAGTARRRTTITVNGELTPAGGGEVVRVARFAAGRWTSKLAPVASNGTFVTRWRVDRESAFVAQVLGDAHHRGAGTRPLTVHVR